MGVRISIENPFILSAVYVIIEDTEKSPSEN